MKGIGYAELVREIAILAAQSLVIVLLATLRVRKQFDFCRSVGLIKFTFFNTSNLPRHK